MRIVVVGGAGRLGSSVVAVLRERGHDVLAASRGAGFDVLTGEGVAAGLEGAQVVVDVSNSPSFEDAAVLDFFQRSSQVLFPAERSAQVGHHVALSIVGAERAAESGYMRAKIAHEQLVRESQLPFTIVRATQFFEFLRAVVDSATSGDQVRLPSSALQPIAVADLAAAVADIAESAPLNDAVEVAGPEAIALDELARQILAADADHRTVVRDESAGYFGARVDDSSLTPRGAARLGTTRLADWLGHVTP